MLQTVSEPHTEQKETRRDGHLAAYRFMLRARLLDDKLAALYRAGKIHGGVFLGRGQEALSAAIGVSLTKGDVFAPLIRDAAGRLAFGENILDSVRTYLGSATGPMRGRDGNVHRGNPREGLLPMISHLGAMVSVVNGILFARRMKKISGTVGVACLGEGATSTGAFHEALNQAAVEKLPLVLVVADNQYAYSTPTSRQFACEELTDKSAGYGVAAHAVDGTDLTACLKVVGEAVAAARAGNGPQLVIAKLLRLCGHGEHDPDGDVTQSKQGYIDPKLKKSPLGRDCLKLAEEILLKEKFADATRLAVWRNETLHEIEEVVAQVQREPTPDPFVEKWVAISSGHLTEGRHE
ncbi:MAG TPA: thiamine pyrophosphate-dependent dehydrogenase E1 component subunit alpha [Candidatus Sulfotelmatobacter sp.]|jgi:TPP-dependent pyruvate/acetoin dehydrogenase alpha subunit|nr:thiamine pyrophosphate-dependent dehydrogenase E1 component subunit alpha [Candidatus Sulfotelmatobacter sp.]